MQSSLAPTPKQVPSTPSTLAGQHFYFRTPPCNGAAKGSGGRGQSHGKGKGPSVVCTPGIFSADTLRLGNELSSPQLQDHVQAFLNGIPRERNLRDNKAPTNQPDIQALL